MRRYSFLFIFFLFFSVPILPPFHPSSILVSSLGFSIYSWSSSRLATLSPSLGAFRYLPPISSYLNFCLRCRLTPTSPCPGFLKRPSHKWAFSQRIRTPAAVSPVPPVRSITCCVPARWSLCTPLQRFFFAEPDRGYRPSLCGLLVGKRAHHLFIRSPFHFSEVVAAYMVTGQSCRPIYSFIQFL